jgi:small subunit ribosomal protein S9
MAEAKTDKYFYGTGRRKTATARVRLFATNSDMVINGMKANEYLKPAGLVDQLIQPLALVGHKGMGFSVKVAGGGMTSQAGAIRHGIARALLAMDENLKTTLKKAKFLTRDPREKERKKYGLKRARRAPQFSKR